ncbi:PucR family transcriptional regulator [Cryptosporangium phraense]|uniref:PucR family transcriptional regulator n=1 Tax=Cryptosporangium phraense TaxID=2593070 RepID=A0A545AJV2_9ACTN|nr:PucR family transcriptional regulator [Cryptosporangium phraense]TQS41520.1 PucR family transcriptional regulator [Cryptosporangium phraense]
MALTLAEVLEFEAVREARPLVLTGQDALGRAVRWVHSSEIYEIGPLLSGGELLLTTGLGLAGSDAGARRHYVRELVDAGVSGLAVEIGRTFPELPAELADEASRRGLPLIALRAVVPFIRMCEAANTAIVDEAARRLRLGDRVTRALNEALISGAGVAGLLRTAAEVAGTATVLTTASGALVASHGVPDDHAAWRAVDSAQASSEVIVHGRSWGRVVAAGGSSLAPEDLAATVERTATALAVEILRTGDPPTERERHAAAFLSDLVGGAAPAPAETVVRTGLAGFRPPPGRLLIGVAIDAPETRPAVTLVDQAARLLGTSALRARVRESVLALVVAPEAGDPVGALETAFADAGRRSGAPQVTVALGYAVPGAAAAGGTAAGGTAAGGTAAWAASLELARAALALALAGTSRGAARPGSRPVIVAARTLALELELSRRAAPGQLDAFVERTIGPLIVWDARHRTGLVRTLELYLRHGASATKTAAALHLRRQSLYQRLERIETLLGHSPAAPDLYPALLAACVCVSVLHRR